MSNISQTEANNILGASVAGVAYSAPTTPVNLALMTANGSNTAFGTEVTGGSYARQSTASAWGSPASGSITNSAGSVSFTAMPACTIVGIELWDSQTRNVTDGVLNSTTTITSASASFAATDIGRSVVDTSTGAHIPTGAYIASVTNSTTAVLSAAATATASSEHLTIGTKRNWFGTLTASKTVNVGDTVTFATSSVTVSLA